MQTPSTLIEKKNGELIYSSKTLLQVLEVVVTVGLWERVLRRVLGTHSTPCTSRPVDTPHPLEERGAGGEGVTMAQPDRGLRTHGMRTVITGKMYYQQSMGESCHEFAYVVSRVLHAPCWCLLFRWPSPSLPPTLKKGTTLQRNNNNYDHHEMMQASRYYGTSGKGQSRSVFTSRVSVFLIWP